MQDASWLAAHHDMLDVGFVPRGIAAPKGFDGRGHLTFYFLLGGVEHLICSLWGSLARCRCDFVALSSVGLLAYCERALTMEKLLVALSTVRGEGLSGSEPQSGSNMVRQRGAIGLGGKVSFWQSDSQ